MENIGILTSNGKYHRDVDAAVLNNEPVGLSSKVAYSLLEPFARFWLEQPVGAPIKVADYRAWLNAKGLSTADEVNELVEFVNLLHGYLNGRVNFVTVWVALFGLTVGPDQQQRMLAGRFRDFNAWLAVNGLGTASREQFKDGCFHAKPFLRLCWNADDEMAIRGK